MDSARYHTRRAEIETYFDRTAAATWETLTSDAPVSRIRRTVRRGRDEMRDTLLSWLPADLAGTRLLDAGCGTGTLAIEAARRGAEVVAIAQARLLDLDSTLAVSFRVGDMRDMDLGHFDYAVAMDSLIHYDVNDGVQTLAAMAAEIKTKMVFTFAPWTPLLAMMHATGRFFPKQDRAPSIEPVSPKRLSGQLAEAGLLSEWDIDRSYRVDTGFYKSQAMELSRR